MEDPARHRDLWLPGLIGLAGLLVSLSGWGLLVAERREGILENTRSTAAEVREALELGLEQQLEALHGLAALWATFGLRPEAEWRANVEQRVDHIAGLTSVTWIDLDEPRNRLVAGQERAAEIDVEALRRHRDRDHLEGPGLDPSGAARYRVSVPVRTPEDHAGVLVADFDPAAFLEAALRARARGYALSVLWDGEEIFARDTPSADRWQGWWWVEEMVALPLSGHWRVLQRPTTDYAAARLTPIPHYLLAAGISLSLVLAVLAHQLRVIVRQSRFLAATNRALEQRGVELESRVAERTEALEEAVSELEAFNYSVSHDLRSPLAAILNLAAILEEDYRDRPLDEAGLALLVRIRRSANRATTLLEDLLRLSRAGRAALCLESVDMGALAREVFAQVRVAEADADVDFVVDPLPEAVADRSLLGDVFANLFTNALKYSRGREKRRIHVVGHITAGECIYEVADNGQGFDMRFVDKLFGLFERLHADDDVEGTGVGLAMVGRIVRRHGGRVWAEGRLGEGARFGFALPRRLPS